MHSCYRCGTGLEPPKPVGRSESCPSCGAAVRCCRNCTFYDPAAHWECRETVGERVNDKEAANFCDWFRLAQAAQKQDSTWKSRRDSARDSFDKLFGQ